MKNQLVDLNDHLFAQLERMSEEGLSAEQIAIEVKRSEAIVQLSDQIIRGADLKLRAVKLVATHGDRFKPMLPQIEGPSK